MITCPFCKSPVEANTNYCSNCGKKLAHNGDRAVSHQVDAPGKADVAEDDRKTDPAGNQIVDTDILVPRPQTDRVPLAFRFIIGTQKRKVVIPLNNIIRIGRRDPSLDLFPEIDVTDDGVEAKSVSRRHAIITRQDNLIIIVDENSSNGTFVNKKKMKSFAFEPLHTGDILQLGQLRIEVKF